MNHTHINHSSYVIDRSRRDDDRSRQRDDDRPRRDDDRSRRNEKRSERDDSSQKRDGVRSKPDEADGKLKDSSKPNNAKEENNSENYLTSKRGKPATDGDLMTRTGGAYIPPARLRMMQAQITDKSSAQYQRIAWEALKKSINGLINKVNVSNLSMIVRELLQENIVRGRYVKDCIEFTFDYLWTGLNDLKIAFRMTFITFRIQ